jgi:hypothetical protein
LPRALEHAWIRRFIREESPTASPVERAARALEETHD